MTTNFEAKLHGFRRTQDGVVVSYVVHPSDVSAELATAALGTRYMVAVAEIGDDERPVTGTERGDIPKSHKDRGCPVAPDPSQTKDRRPFASLPLSQQAALRTDDKSFQDFLETQTSIHDEESYADAVRAICGVESRADIRPGTPAEILWLGLEGGYQRWLTDQRYADARR